MSLFKARDWWCTQCGSPEERFVHSGMCLANIDNDSSGTDKIVVGSLSGVLRVYRPTLSWATRKLDRGEGEEGEGSSEEGMEEAPVGFQVGDLLVEAQLTAPIIDVAAGRLVSGSTKLHLAVLHPRRLSVYLISSSSSTTTSALSCQYRADLCYEHTLARSTHSLMVGPFGGVGESSRDFMCVQTLDGTLFFYEQETFSFSRFLPGFLLPGPVAYVERSDSIVTVSSAWRLESYRYQVLAVASDADSDSKPETTRGTGKKATSDWSFNLGEPALELAVVPSKTGSASLVVVAQSNLYCFKDTGVLRFMKRIDYDPMCGQSYLSPKVAKIMTLIASHTDTLMVYEDVTLRWAAQLPFSPVTVLRGSFQESEGVLVMLSEEGQLICAYLGTEPELFSAPPPEAREWNYEETDKELAALQAAIREASKADDFPIGKGKSASGGSTEGPLVVGVSLSMSQPQRVDGLIKILARVALGKVQVLLRVEEPIVVNQTMFSLPTLNGTCQLPVMFYLQDACIPPSLEIKIVVTCVTSSGVPFVVQHESQLPLQMVVQPCPPLKEADFKVTLSTNRPALSLVELFPEFDLDEAMSNALGLEYQNGPSVTLLSSKTSQRYRLQSDFLPALNLVTAELVRRLQARFGPDASSTKGGSSRKKDFVCCYSSPLPLQEYFCEVEAHFMRREKERILKRQLAQSTAQFRAVQRRLLTKFKDKNPMPLTNLDSLLEGSYFQVLQLTQQVEENETMLRQSRCHLSGATRVILLLVHLMTGIPEEEFDTLESAISPYLLESDEQGWEEVTDVATAYLLRVAMPKTGREVVSTSTATLEVPKDTSRLKKHLGLVLDKLSKGANVGDPRDGQISQRPLTPAIPDSVLPDHPEGIGQEEDVPAGLRFGSARSRVRRETDVENRPEAGDQRAVRSAVKRGKSATPSLSTVVESPPEVFSSGAEEGETW